MKVGEIAVFKIPLSRDAIVLSCGVTTIYVSIIRLTSKHSKAKVYSMHKSEMGMNYCFVKILVGLKCQ
jgi:hypothetical protein